jgi:hypothetical protein
VSAVALLLGLLVVAYVGSQLMGGKGTGYRLASGAEYLLLGIALGPYALGAVDRSTLHAFQPLAVVGTAWLTLIIGVDFGFQGERRVTLRGFGAGVALALLSAAGVAGPVFAVLSRFTPLGGRELLLIAAGVGCVGCETTRHAVRWVIGRHGAEGKLTRLVGDVADCDDLVPILGISMLFPFVDAPPVSTHLPWWAWAFGTPLLGIVLGGTAVALLRAEPRASDGWGVLIGAALLGTGIAWRLGLAPQAATFAIGLSLSLLSRHRSELRSMLVRSEHAVLLPTLLLAGADVEVHGVTLLSAVVSSAFAARALARFVAAPALTALAGAPRSVAPALAIGLLPSGALSVTLGLAFASRFPGTAGDVILGAAVALALLGELVGPAALRRALARAGEIALPSLEPVTPAASAAPSPEPAP